MTTPTPPTGAAVGHAQDQPRNDRGVPSPRLQLSVDRLQFSRRNEGTPRGVLLCFCDCGTVLCSASHFGNYSVSEGTTL